MTRDTTVAQRARSGTLVVMHTGARDQYQVAVALAERGRLRSLVTNSFFRSDSRLRSLLSAFARGRQLVASRQRPEVPDALVRPAFGAELAYRLVSRVAPSHRNWAFARQEAWLGRIAAAEARRCAGILSYNYCAYPAFRRLGGSGALKILFQCHPHPDTARAILSEEIARRPDHRDSLLFEKETSWGEAYLQQLRTEPAVADAIVVASTFTMRSLVANGIPESRIAVIPYGSDHLAGIGERRGGDARSPFRILFVGQAVQRKGIGYLLEACRQIDMRGAELRICGRGAPPDAALRRPHPTWLVLRQDLTDAELVEEYQRASVFVLPSLLEGFGLAFLEAMAFGVPVVTTANTGAPDLIEDGVSGILVPVRSAAAIAQVLTGLRMAPERAAALGAAGRAVARTHSWERFRARLGETVEGFVRGHRKTGPAPGETG